MASQTARLERETEEARARVEQTLDELRYRVSPGQLLDQATDYFRNSNGRAFASNLGQQVTANPLPVTLVGAGIAWLAFSALRDQRGHDYRAPRSRNNESSRSGSAEGKRPREHAGRPSNAGEWVGEAGEAVSDAAESIRETAGQYKDSAGRLYRDTAQGVRRAASAAVDYGHTLRQAVGSDGTLMELCRREPVLIAGIGLAMGAILGGLLPATSTEQRVMGKASRNVKDQLGDIKEAALDPLRSSGSSEPGNGRAYGDPDLTPGQDEANRTS